MKWCAMGKSGRSNKDMKITNYGRHKNERDEDDSFEFLSRSVRQGVNCAVFEDEEAEAVIPSVVEESLESRSED